ncbi:hypothetical protein PQR02_39030, partial [Paraburkholderia sediminicola]
METAARRTHSALRASVKEEAGSSEPCNSSSEAGEIVLENAPKGIYVLKEIVEEIKKRNGWNEHLPANQEEAKLKKEKLLKAANLVAAYSKFLMIYAFFEADLTIDKVPLRRLTTTMAGEQAKVSATARFGFGGAKWYNCFAGLLATAGLAVRLPNNGPIAHAGSTWVLTDDGRTPGPRGILDAIVRFNGINPAVATANLTDENGMVSVGIEGAPTQEYISAESAVDVDKRATVVAFFVLKPADFVRDVTEATVT